MNNLTPSPGMTPEATGGSPTTQVNIKPAAGPHFDLCRECLGEGIIYGCATNDPGEKEKSRECDRCNGDGYEPEWKPSEDMRDVAEDAFDNIHDMDVPVSAYCEAILIACRPLIIAEYEESKNVFDK